MALLPVGVKGRRSAVQIVIVVLGMLLATAGVAAAQEMERAPTATPAASDHPNVEAAQVRAPRDTARATVEAAAPAASLPDGADACGDPYVPLVVCLRAMRQMERFLKSRDPAQR